MAEEASSVPDMQPETQPERGQHLSPGLEAEANEALRQTRHLVDKSHMQNASADEETLDREEAEEQIITRALEEASLEKLHDPPDPATDPGPPKVSVHDERISDPFNFPAIPTHAPVTDEGSDEAGTEEDARMRLLMGLSGPTSKPTTKLPTAPSAKPTERQAGQGWNLPGYVDERDDDLESWCCESSYGSAGPAVPCG